MRALVVDTVELDQATEAAQLLRDLGCDVTIASGYQEALEATRRVIFGAVILSPPPVPLPSTRTDLFDQFYDLLEAINVQHLPAILVTDRPVSVGDEGESFIATVEPSVTTAELRGRFAMLDRYHHRLRSVEAELATVERLSQQLHEHFHELDQEMRLAARLQKDFLPDITKPIHGVQFVAIYRPASWVSGDIFDVFRIDEHHTGFYIADAVGHGVAASLLTMFIKRSMLAKRVHASGYTILDPSESLAILNDALVEQALPNCQFVTACYGLLDHRTGVLRYARAGHPYPIVFTAQGQAMELQADGGLLGLFKGECFPTEQVTLVRGDKFVFFSDGVELAFTSEEESRCTHAYAAVFQSLAHLPVLDMVQAIEDRLDREEGSLNPKDDVTIVALEILGGDTRLQ